METNIIEFAKQGGLAVKAFVKCDSETNRIRCLIENMFDEPPFTSDLDVVVFGSIARNECTLGSDVDWTLLIDGQADGEHLRTVEKIRKKINEIPLLQPNTGGMFGNSVISHSLIHHIGGQNDSNHNLTRRILLLLESQKINFISGTTSTGTAYDRVISGIIGEYVVHDSGLYSEKKMIPRFLLNDIVRYWRTMCVDFAFKQREDGGKKWALRNIKLRMSRKLLFVKGLLMCFAQHSSKPERTELIASIKEMALMRPLELLLGVSEQFSIPNTLILSLLGFYDEFLDALNNNDVRTELEQTHMVDVYSNQVFLNLRKLCDEFQATLDDIFINGNNELSKLTLKYGIF